MERLRLTKYAQTKAKNLSLGNSQRLGMAKALLHRPEILILDEPVNGLDPAGMVEIRELLQDLARNHGVTVLISSHLLSEVAKIATHIGIIHEGELIQEIPSRQLKKLLYPRLTVNTRHNKAALAALNSAGLHFLLSMKKDFWKRPTKRRCEILMKSPACSSMKDFLLRSSCLCWSFRKWLPHWDTETIFPGPFPLFTRCGGGEAFLGCGPHPDHFVNGNHRNDRCHLAVGFCRPALVERKGRIFTSGPLHIIRKINREYWRILNFLYGKTLNTRISCNTLP